MQMLRKEKIEQEEKHWEEEKILLQRHQKINKEKEEFKQKRITTTKLIVLFLFVNCTLIELFTGWTIIQSIELAKVTGLSPDFSPLVTLIGAVVGEVFSFAVYALKSSKENSKGGIVYDAAMQNNNDDMEHFG
jgi:Ca2+/Na+ antiporter